MLTKEQKEIAIEYYLKGLSAALAATKASIGVTSLRKILKERRLLRARTGLTEADLTEIVKLLRKGEAICTLARRYHVGRKTILRRIGGVMIIKDKKEWKIPSIPATQEQKNLIKQGFLFGDEPSYTATRLCIPLYTVRYEYHHLQSCR